MLHPHGTRVACTTEASLAYAEAQQSRSAIPGVYPITSECTCGVLLPVRMLTVSKRLGPSLKHKHHHNGVTQL